MKIAILGLAAAAALAVGAWAQTSKAVDDRGKESKQSTYEVIVDGKVVAKGKLSDKDSKGIQVKVNGKTVVESTGGEPLSRYFILKGDGKLPSMLKELETDRLPLFDGKQIPDMQWLKEHIAKIEEMLQGAHPGLDMQGHLFLSPDGQDPKNWIDGKSMQEFFKEFKLGDGDHLFLSPDGQDPKNWIDGKSMQEFFKEFKLGDGDHLFLSPDGKDSKNWIDGKSMEEFFKEHKLGEPGSTLVIPKDGLRFLTSDSANVPTVKFEDDGAYKVLLGKKVIAEGKTDAKESRSVSIKVENDKYTVEVNGKVVAEGELPKKG